MTTTLLLTFFGASMAITIAPGPDNLFVLTQGIARGRREQKGEADVTCFAPTGPDQSINFNAFLCAPCRDRPRKVALATHSASPSATRPHSSTRPP